MWKVEVLIGSDWVWEISLGTCGWFQTQEQSDAAGLVRCRERGYPVFRSVYDPAQYRF